MTQPHARRRFDRHRGHSAAIWTPKVLTIVSLVKWVIVIAEVCVVIFAEFLRTTFEKSTRIAIAYKIRNCCEKHLFFFLFFVFFLFVLYDVLLLCLLARLLFWRVILKQFSFLHCYTHIIRSAFSFGPRRITTTEIDENTRLRARKKIQVSVIRSNKTHIMYKVLKLVTYCDRFERLKVAIKSASGSGNLSEFSFLIQIVMNKGVTVASIAAVYRLPVRGTVFESAVGRIGPERPGPPNALSKIRVAYKFLRELIDKLTTLARPGFQEEALEARL